ncbi:MAG: thioesterase family protein [Actinobacteria bacterium]|nr:thioesterase family protein [Actinomycetota bacterium]
MARALERDAHEREDVGVVVDDEDARHAGIIASGAPTCLADAQRSGARRRTPEVRHRRRPTRSQAPPAAADFANGLSWILPFDEWLFVNTELTVHLHREPAGEWIGLDARTISDASGIGLSTGLLHDLHGPFGVCAQALFVERR